VDAHDADELDEATRSLRELILGAEYYRQVASNALGLGVSDSQAVSYLYARGSIGQTALGDLLGYNTGTMTVLVDRLERSGVAERIPHPTDRRRLIVQLTPAGREIVERASRTLGAAFRHIPPDQLRAVTVALNAIGADLRELATSDLVEGTLT
jgi:DNA-binding MarR family transcriptional regulator